MQTLLRLAEGIEKFIDRLGRWTAWLVLGMLAIGVWNVLGRYGGRLLGQNLTSNSLLEMQWYLFDLLFLLGAAYALQQDDHVRVDIIYKSLSPKWRAFVNLLGTLFFLFPFSALVIYYSWGSILNSWQIWEMSPDPGGLPRYPIKSLIIVSFVLLIIQGFADLIKNWVIFIGDRPSLEDNHGPNL